MKFTLLLLASVYLPLLQGAKIKINIHLPDDYVHSQQRNSRQAAATACSDKVTVPRSRLCYTVNSGY